jgi:hypothetical protein
MRLVAAFGVSEATLAHSWRTVRRERLDSSGRNSRPETGSLHPRAIEVGFLVTKSTVF